MTSNARGPVVAPELDAFYHVLEPIDDETYIDNTPEGLTARRDVIEGVRRAVELYREEIQGSEFPVLVSRDRLRNAAKHLYAVIDAWEADMAADADQSAKAERRGKDFSIDAIGVADCYDVEIALATALKVSVFELQAQSV